MSQRGTHAAVLLAVAIGAAACSSGPPVSRDSAVTTQPIDAVLRAHTDSLMRLPGVVGTAIGLCDNAPCIKVLVARVTPDLRRAIPDSLDGHRVIIEETGVITPQQRKVP